MQVFSLGAILSVTHSALLCPIAHVYEMLNYLTGANLMTHQLIRARAVAAPQLLEQFPDLLHIDVSHITPQNWQAELRALEQEYGASREVCPLPPGMYQQRDPIEEWIEMRGGTDGIILVNVDE